MDTSPMIPRPAEGSLDIERLVRTGALRSKIEWPSAVDKPNGLDWWPYALAAGLAIAFGAWQWWPFIRALF